MSFGSVGSSTSSQPTMLFPCLLTMACSFLLKYSCSPAVPFQPMRANEFLNLRIGVPLFPIHFIAAHMKKMIGEKFADLPDELIKKFVNLLVGRIHRRVENAPLALNRKRPRRAGQLRITHKPRRAVPRKIKFRHYLNPPLPRISDQPANFILCVVQPVRTHPLQFRKFLALHPETLIFRKVPVKYIHLYRFHAVDIPA